MLLEIEASAVIAVDSPITWELVGQVPCFSADEVSAVAQTVRAAQPDWAAWPIRERTQIVKRFHDIVLRDRDEIFDILQAETGKSRRDAFVEIFAVASEARYYAYHSPRHLRPRRVKSAIPLRDRTKVIYHPLGVVGIISPWNFPFILSVSDAIPALLAGNGVLLKPATLTPLSAVWGREKLIEAGLPADLFQVVTGPGRDLGDALIDNSDYVMFTGSTEVGRSVAQRAAGRLLPFSMELGGKNALLVLPDANLKRAARVAIEGAFNNCGQVCINWERLYVHTDSYDAFREEIIRQTRELRLGAVKDFSVDLGSVISEEQIQITENHLQDAVHKGAKVIVGGQRREDIGPLFYEPTILEDVQPGMDVWSKETFGPLLAMYRYGSVDEAVHLINDSCYGLHCGVFTRNRRQGEQVAARLQAGSVSVNDSYMNWAAMDAPMGGVKESGMGRRHGPEGIRKYTEPQTIVTNLTGFQISSYETALAINDRLAGALVVLLRLWRRIPFLR
ncbi:MAG: aldehyde dehydrogenase family protein [Anaerolineae bacterium]|nr:aldehyde dehydrogenase family protein [Anaerolineae bacterium]